MANWGRRNPRGTVFSRCETDFNLDRHLVVFIQELPFFAELSRHIRKIPTQALPTAAIAFDVKADEVTLYWNPTFFAGLGNNQIRGVLTHEFYHFVFGHLNARRKTPARMWNVATDLAINSIIIDNAKQTLSREALSSGDGALPRGCLIPGQWPEHPTGRDLSKEEREGSKLGALIATMPTMNASEWYFNELMKAAQEDAQNGGGEFSGLGDSWIDSIDDHTQWDEIPEDMREYVEGRIKSLVEKAVRHADSQANGWGNMPSSLREDIRRSVSHIVNWRNVLRQFAGALVRGNRSTSIKRINKRYPYVHPGMKRGYVARLLVAMDQSGSVDDGMVELFFSELRSLTKRVTIDVLPFDAAADEKDIFTWNRGRTPAIQRVKCGGTNFSAPTRLANDPKNRGKWDGMLIMTDGQCDAPVASRIKRGWVLGKGCKLMFSSPDLQICLDDQAPASGAWR